MGFLLELLFDLIIEGSVEGASSNKVPKIIRYILIAFLLGICGFFVILLIAATVISVNEGNIPLALLFIAADILMVTGIILKSRQIYIKHKNVR